jgi:hypothetical protein
MNYRNLKGKSKEDGQAFMELVFILPLFFILIGGILTIFFQLMRVTSEAHGSFALVSSQATFSAAERNAGGWINPIAGQSDSAALGKALVETVLNAKKYTHPDALNAIVKGVSALEKKGAPGTQQNCDPQFALGMPGEKDADDKSQFSLKTCAGQTGFENKGLEFIPREGDVNRKYHIEMDGIQRDVLASALYLPQKEYSYAVRGDWPARAYGEKTSEFEEKFASSESKKESNFVQKCQMDYLKNDSCKEDKRALGITVDTTPYDILEKVRTASAGVQYLACWAEACTKTCEVWPIALAEAGLITAAWGAGQKYQNCGIVNSAIEGLHTAAIKAAEARSLLVKGKEKELLMRLEVGRAKQIPDTLKSNFKF